VEYPGRKKPLYKYKGYSKLILKCIIILKKYSYVGFQPIRLGNVGASQISNLHEKIQIIFFEFRCCISVHLCNNNLVSCVYIAIILYYFFFFIEPH